MSATRFRIPVDWQQPSGVDIDAISVKPSQAAALLGICRTTLWKLTATGTIRQTVVGTYDVNELRRFSREETR